MESEDRERLFAEVVERVGAPDILVNNAAVTFLRPLDEFPDKRVRLMIVNTASFAGLFTYSYDRLPYAATKAAIARSPKDCASTCTLRASG